MNRTTLRSLTFGLAALACRQPEPEPRARPEDPLDTGTAQVEAPRLTWTPEEVRFAQPLPGETTRADLTLRNVGDAPLWLAELRPEASPSFRVLDPPGPRWLDPGSTLPLTLVFEPLQPGENLGYLRVATDESSASLRWIRLRGDGDVPQLVSRPVELDFGVRRDECPRARTLEIVNEGTTPARITDYHTGGRYLQVSSTRLPVELQPGEALALRVLYTPPSPSPTALYSGLLSVFSDDPAGPLLVPYQARHDSYERTEQFLGADPGKVDLLLVVDGSAASALAREQLAASWVNWIPQLTAAADRWQVGVLDPGTGCLRGPLIRPDQPDHLEQLRAALEDPSLPPVTDPLSSLVQAIDLAEADTCKQGLLRPASQLHALVLTADSPPPALVDDPLDRLAQRLRSPDRLRISVAIDPTGACGGEAPELRAAAEGAGGLILDLCRDDWASGLDQLPDRTAWSLQTLQLAHEPFYSDVEVHRASDRRVTLDHTLEPGGRVILAEPVPPFRRAEVRYWHRACPRPTE